MLVETSNDNDSETIEHAPSHNNIFMTPTRESAIIPPKYC